MTARRAQREVVLKMLRQLAQYVEAVADNDPAVIARSGFDAMSVARSAPQPLSTPAIRRIDQGISGQLLIVIPGIRKAQTYELRQATVATGGAVGPWTSQMVTSVKGPFAWNGLTPGTTYTFQVRALGRLGFTDWSASFTRMCI